MNLVLPEGRAFSFVERPTPIPGDLRISWRIALALLMLAKSRGRKASLAKLHLFNDALRSPNAAIKIERILKGKLPALSWRMRVEPAFGRAIDFLVGEGFADWGVASGRAGLTLTEKGFVAAQAVQEYGDALIEEKAFLDVYGKAITEKFVANVLAAGRKL